MKYIALLFLTALISACSTAVNAPQESVAEEPQGIAVGEPNPAVPCTLEYAPVCGEDGNTYPNTCAAEKQAGVAVAHKGTCEEYEFDNSGEDEGRVNPDVLCIEIYEPVCGEDGKTYSNRCVAEEQNGVQMAYEGTCEDQEYTDNEIVDPIPEELQ